MKEHQLRVTIKDSQNREHKITYRSANFQHPDDLVSVMHKQSSNVTLHTKVGDSVYWYGSDMYMTKRSGVVTEAVPLIWDYSKPIGERAIFI